MDVWWAGDWCPCLLVVVGFAPGWVDVGTSVMSRRCLDRSRGWGLWVGAGVVLGLPGGCVSPGLPSPPRGGSSDLFESLLGRLFLCCCCFFLSLSQDSLMVCFCCQPWPLPELYLLKWDV